MEKITMVWDLVDAEADEEEARYRFFLLLFRNYQLERSNPCSQLFNLVSETSVNLMMMTTPHSRSQKNCR